MIKSCVSSSVLGGFCTFLAVHSFLAGCSSIEPRSGIASNKVALREPAVGNVLGDAIITTDCGTDVDDQWTIVHSSLSEQVHLLAVYGDFAPNAHDTVNCAMQALKVAGREQIPVLQGATEPMKDAVTPQQNAAVDDLIRTSKAYSSSNRLFVLGLGPGSDLASALLQDPSVADRVQYFALAFDAYPKGGDGWNVSNDLKAWQIILKSNVPINIILGTFAEERMQLYRRAEGNTLFTDEALTRPLFPKSNPVTDYLSSLWSTYLSTNWVYFNGEMGKGTHWPIWDDAVFGGFLGYAQWEAVTRPTLDDDLSFRFPNGKSQAPFSIAKQIDRDGVFGDLVRLVSTPTR